MQQLDGGQANLRLMIIGKRVWEEEDAARRVFGSAVQSGFVKLAHPSPPGPSRQRAARIDAQKAFVEPVSHPATCQPVGQRGEAASPAAEEGDMAEQPIAPRETMLAVIMMQKLRL